MRSCNDSDENKLKCGASEFLDMYPIFEHMVETWCLKAAMEAEVVSLLSMFRVLDKLLAPSADPSRLLRAMRRSMRLHMKACSGNVLVPKWHAALHVPSQMKERGHAFAFEMKEQGTCRAACHFGTKTLPE